MQGVAPLKDEKGVTIVNAFQKILDNSTKLHSMRKTNNKIWVDNGSEFYNSSFKKWLKDNKIEIYSTKMTENLLLLKDLLEL